uniref:Putative secreted protein n=1 Tax=Anopheles triannulatus TaxID=58253 RepID=A0A2M4B496_9DIPT
MPDPCWFLSWLRILYVHAHSVYLSVASACSSSSSSSRRLRRVVFLEPPNKRWFCSGASGNNRLALWNVWHAWSLSSHAVRQCTG